MLAFTLASVSCHKATNYIDTFVLFSLSNICSELFRVRFLSRSVSVFFLEILLIIFKNIKPIAHIRLEFESKQREISY